MAFISLGVAALLAASAALSVGGALGAQALSNKSQKETNEANKELNQSNNTFNAQQADVARQFDAEQADITRVFNAQEAEKQRQFEERMSNTQVQRRVADLEAAGMNPMLAVTNGSASTPGAYGASSGMASGSQANASGFLPMRAMDYSPMAQLSSNLGHMVSSASSILILNKMANNNPGVMSKLASISKDMTKRVTSTAQYDKIAKATGKMTSDELAAFLNAAK